jgi:biopolymer transport protein ExbB/TolQ
MTQTQPDPTESQPGAAGPQTKKHPWHWIVPCVLLALVAIGLGIWALNLNGDLDDQKDANQALQQQNASTQQQVQDVSNQVDDVNQTVNEAADDLSQQNAQAQKEAQSALANAKDALESVSTDLKGALQKLGDELKTAQSSGDQPQG